MQRIPFVRSIQVCDGFTNVLDAGLLSRIMRTLVALTNRMMAFYDTIIGTMLSEQ